MDKIKINLLPKEVLEKRKAEQRLVLMFLGLAAIVMTIFLVYGFNFVRLIGEQSTLDELKLESSRLEAEIAKIQNYEQDKIQIEEREKLVNTAIADKYDWSRFLNNVSLIVPNEVWLQALTVSEEAQVTFSGTALASPGILGDGHKPAVKWLLQLSQVPDLIDVWLGSSTKGGSSGGPLGPADSGSAAATDTVETSITVQFSSTAKIKSLQKENSPNAPAPPKPGG